MAIAESQIAPASTLPGISQAPGTFPTEKARAEAAVKAYREVIAAYPDTDAGRTAAYQLASELVAAGQLAEAEAEYRKLTSQPETSLPGALARLGLAETLSLQGKHDEAIKTYTELAAVRDSVMPVDGILMALAKAQAKAGKTQDAKATYKRIVDEFPESTYVTQARQQMGLLR